MTQPLIAGPDLFSAPVYVSLSAGESFLLLVSLLKFFGQVPSRTCRCRHSLYSFMDWYKYSASGKSQSKQLTRKKYGNFAQIGTNNSSFDHVTMKIKAKFNFSGKCAQLWNAFEHPTQLTHKKIDINSQRLRKRREKSLENQMIVKKSKFCLPPIRNIFLKVDGNNDKSDAESEDDYGILVKNIYKL